MRKLCIVSMVIIIAALSGARASRDRTPFLREVEGVPVLFENDMPYFTRFQETDHELLDLAGTWRFKPDPDDAGMERGWHEPELDDSDWFDHPVPGSWNSQRDEWLYYQGAGWYRTWFTPPDSMRGKFNRLVLDGVAYRGDVFINGEPAGSHQGGFSRWSLDVTDRLKYGKENLLAIRVDNRRDYTSLPALKVKGGALGWWFYGGIHRVAMIESGPSVTIPKLAATTDHLGGIRCEGVLYNHGADREEAEVSVRLADLSGRSIENLFNGKLAPDGGGMSAFRFEDKLEGVKPWSPDQPGNRYVLEVSVKSGAGWERQSVQIAFKTFEFRGTQAYLNGEPVFLRGVNRHEDFPGAGQVLTDKWMEKDLELLDELHVNFMRPAHYPHDPRWLDACDRAGIMITHEIPFYQLGSSIPSARAVMGDKLFHNAARQLAETIERDRNHPCVVMWSVGNENRTFLPWVKKFHKKLIGVSRRMDPARPVTFAVSTDWFFSPWYEITAELADVIFINEYYGWYFDGSEGVSEYLDKVHRKWPEKPVVVSEFGAGAYAEVDGETEYSVGMVDRDFTCEYQAWHHKTQLEIFLSKPFVTGTMPWVFADFRDDKRPNNPKKDFNLKGLVTYDREKKPAFEVVAEVYERIEEGSR